MAKRNLGNMTVTLKSPKVINGNVVCSLYDPKLLFRASASTVIETDSAWMRFWASPDDCDLTVVKEIEKDVMKSLGEWCEEHDIPCPDSVHTTLTQEIEGMILIKARVPRMGHSLKKMDKAEFTAAVRDLRINNNVCYINWRVEEVGQINESDSDDEVVIQDDKEDEQHNKDVKDEEQEDIRERVVERDQAPPRRQDEKEEEEQEQADQDTESVSIFKERGPIAWDEDNVRSFFSRLDERLASIEKRLSA